MVNEYGCEIPAHFPFSELASFVVMPNHIHGIIMIPQAVGTRHAVSAESFGRPVAGSLPTIIRSFKSATTRRLHANGYGAISPVWQKGYYEPLLSKLGENELLSS
jgi:REP element-mobilizing transposase RayT